jgi:hypothetical protein
MYKWHLENPIVELWKTNLSAISRICKLHIQISNVHMCVVPGPASQDAVFKSVYASPGLQCKGGLVGATKKNCPSPTILPIQIQIINSNDSACNSNTTSSNKASCRSRHAAGSHVDAAAAMPVVATTHLLDNGGSEAKGGDSEAGWRWRLIHPQLCVILAHATSAVHASLFAIATGTNVATSPWWSMWWMLTQKTWPLYIFVPWILQYTLHMACRIELDFNTTGDLFRQWTQYSSFFNVVESLQSHFILTMSHWSSGLPVCFPSQGTQVQIPRGYLCETGILLLALSRYIGDPDVIDHVWGGLRPEPSLGPHADNVIIPLDLTQLFSPGFMLVAGPPSSFTSDGVGCWGGALWRACILTSFSPCLTGPVDYLFASCHKGPRFKSPGGYLCETGILLLALSHYNVSNLPWF